MPNITKRIHIDAPLDKVWHVLADFGSAEEWAPDVAQSRCSSEVSQGVGAKRLITASTGDVTEEVVVEWNEGHGFTFEIPGGLASIIIKLREAWSVGNAATGTDVVVVMDYERKNGVVNSILDSLVVRRILKNMLVHNLAGLKYHVETGERVTKTTRLPVAAVN